MRPSLPKNTDKAFKRLIEQQKINSFYQKNFTFSSSSSCYSQTGGTTPTFIETLRHFWLQLAIPSFKSLIFLIFSYKTIRRIELLW